MKKRHSREFWRGLLAEYEESELTAKAFAEERGVNVHTFKWWVKRLRDERRSRAVEAGSGFVEVTECRLPVAVQQVSGQVWGGGTVRVHMGTAVVVGFDAVPPPEYVAALARCYEGVRG